MDEITTEEANLLLCSISGILWSSRHFKAMAHLRSFNDDILVCSWLSFQLHLSTLRVMTVDRKANGPLECIKHFIAFWVRERVIPVCSALLQPHLEHWVHFWAPQKIKCIKLWESVHRRALELRDLKFRVSLGLTACSH